MNKHTTSTMPTHSNRTYTIPAQTRARPPGDKSTETTRATKLTRIATPPMPGHTTRRRRHRRRGARTIRHQRHRTPTRTCATTTTLDRDPTMQARAHTNTHIQQTPRTTHSHATDAQHSMLILRSDNPRPATTTTTDDEEASGRGALAPRGVSIGPGYPTATQNSTAASHNTTSHRLTPAHVYTPATHAPHDLPTTPETPPPHRYGATPARQLTPDNPTGPRRHEPAAQPRCDASTPATARSAHAGPGADPAAAPSLTPAPRDYAWTGKIWGRTYFHILDYIAVDARTTPRLGRARRRFPSPCGPMTDSTASPLPYTRHFGTPRKDNSACAPNQYDGRSRLRSETGSVHSSNTR